MFNIAVADLEKNLAKVQGSGIRIRILAKSDETVREMLRRLKRWIKRKGLELNAGTNKIMIFRKAGGKRKKYKFK